MMTGVIKWRDDNGVWHEIPALRGGDGFSPVISVEKIDGGHRVTITDADGVKTFDVLDGKNGSESYTIPVATADTLGGVKVGNGLEMNGDVLNAEEPEAVLIETITLSEDVLQVTRHQEPDGTPYSFSTVTVRAVFPPCDKTGNITIYFSLESWEKEFKNYMLTPYNASSSRTGYTKAYLSNKRWRGGWWTCANGQGDFTPYYENPAAQERYGVSDGYIQKINILHSSGIPAGTVFEIWGVRA